MKWIIGPDAVNTCTSIASKFKAKCLDGFNEEFHQQFTVYRPWMSSPHFRAVSKIWTNQDRSTTLITDRQYLADLKEAIEASKLPVLALSDEERVLKIFDNIADKRSDSFATFEAALHLLKTQGGWVGRIYPNVINDIIPVFGTRYVESSNSCTSHHLIGSPFHAIPIPLSIMPIFDLAVSFAHELGHQVLSIYQRSDRIIKSDLIAPVYSGVRGSTRPAIQAFHAAVASAYMVEVSRSIIKQLQGIERNYALEVLEEKYDEFVLTINSLAKEVEFTELGGKMFNEMQEMVIQPFNAKVEA